MDDNLESKWNKNYTKNIYNLDRVSIQDNITLNRERVPYHLDLYKLSTFNENKYQYRLFNTKWFKPHGVYRIHMFKECLQNSDVACGSFTDAYRDLDAYKDFSLKAILGLWDDIYHDKPEDISSIEIIKGKQVHRTCRILTDG